MKATPFVETDGAWSLSCAGRFHHACAIRKSCGCPCHAATVAVVSSAHNSVGEDGVVVDETSGVVDGIPVNERRARTRPGSADTLRVSTTNPHSVVAADGCATPHDPTP